jgi:hypothetical protein
MTPILGPDGLWRALVTVRGGPAVQVVELLAPARPPVDGSSARWAASDSERAPVYPEL